MSSFFVLTIGDIIGLGVAAVLLLVIAGLLAVHYAVRAIRAVRRWWAR